MVPFLSMNEYKPSFFGLEEMSPSVALKVWVALAEKKMVLFRGEVGAVTNDVDTALLELGPDLSNAISYILSKVIQVRILPYVV